MRVLFITTKSPWPLFEGRALRTYNLMREVARHHEVHLVSCIQTEDDAQGIDHMRSMCPVVEAVPLTRGSDRLWVAGAALREPFTDAPLPVLKYRDPGLHAVLRRLALTHHYDLVHLDMLHLADCIDLFPGVPVVLGEHNVEAMILQRRADNERRAPVRAYLRYQASRLERYEARACRRASRVLAVSDPDARQLEAMSGRDDVVTVPNGVDTTFFTPDPARSPAPEMVFVGGFTWFPNEDAIRHFVTDILPLIRARHPEVVLTVVGKQPDTPAVRALAAQPGVRLTGLVDDIRPLVHGAAVYVVPLRIGGGTRLKILDALSMGSAIVSTRIGCEGIEVTDGQDILMADAPQDFADAVCRVLEDPALRDRLGRQGRDLVERRYDWRAVAEDMLRVYDDLVGASAATVGVRA